MAHASTHVDNPMIVVVNYEPTTTVLMGFFSFQTISSLLKMSITALTKPGK